MTRDRVPLATGLMLGFCVLAPAIDMFGKLAAASVPVGQITAARYVVQAAVLVPVALALGLSLRMDARALGLNLLRAALSLASTFTFIAAVRVMPLADALAIAFVEPFLLLLIAHLFLGETVGPRRLAAVAAGFVGTLIVVRPSFAAFGPVALLPLGTALSFALYMLTTRWQRDTHPVTLQATTALAATALSVPLLVLGDGGPLPDLDPLMPSGWAWAWLAGMGLAAASSHLFLTYALRFASATVLAPLHYLELVSATVLGLLVFGDFPDGATWLGIAIIAGSGLYVIHRERVTARAAVPLPYDAS
jgi:drug/metabolite transporter (DMT)-like permease